LILDVILIGACLAACGSCGSGGGFPDSGAPPPVDPGTFAISWVLTDTSGQPISCTDAGATTVHVGITQASNGEQFSTSFECGLGAAVSGELFVASYDLDFTLLDATATITTAPGQTATIQSDRAVSIGPITFVVPSLAALRADIAEATRTGAAKVDALVKRIAVAKRELRGQLPGWEQMLRIADLANDQLGLPPFVQIVPPGPAWRPSPASLLGIAAVVQARTEELAGADRRSDLAALLADERRRYHDGIAEVTERLDEIDRWSAAAARRRPADRSGRAPAR
jgi:hypothetical protein